MSRSSLSALAPIVAGGLIAGTLDIGSASLINLVSPVLILHYIASGLLGARAFAVGAEATYLGLLLQWLMSILIAAIYFVATSRWRSLRSRWWLGGSAAGVITFLVMNFLVMPLSAAPVTYRDIIAHFHPLKAVANLFAMLVFGWIVAYCAARLAGLPQGARKIAADDAHEPIPVRQTPP
jgi:uncharacterized membrane protein YagU involved in acid resistance